MKKIVLYILLTLLETNSFGQSFNLYAPNTSFQSEVGTGFDTRIIIEFLNAAHDPVYFSAQTPSGVYAIFQPDTVLENDTVVLSVVVKDSALVGQSLNFNIVAKDSASEIIITIHLQVPDNPGNAFPEYPAITYRNIAFNFLKNQHPEIVTNFGDFLNYDWLGFWQYPPLWIVSHYVYLTNNWRCNVLWHIMVPPDNWEKVFIYNDIENVCWGVNIDTDGNCTEIPCEKYYYFYQDSIVLSDNAVDSSKSLVTNYPNPCTTFTTIRFSNPGNERHNLTIYNIKWEVIQELNNITTSEVSITNMNWNRGFYFIRLQNKNGLVGYGKIIKY